MGLLNPHLEDDDFADVWSARATSGVQESAAPAEGHLRTCADCRARYASFTGWLDGLRNDAHAEADEIFGRERLASQQSQIFRRLEALEHPGRVIAFPRTPARVEVQPVRRPRWIAAAAAVGLITGVGLGQLLEFPGQRERFVQRPVARVVAPALENARPIQPVSQDNDESFLEPEVTSSQVRVPESLQYLNAITPQARDYDPR